MRISRLSFHFVIQRSLPRISEAGISSFSYAPMQLVAPRAVTIAVAILAIICTMNLTVSLFVINYLLS